MKLGRFRNRIEIQQNSIKEDEYANSLDDWQTIHTVWADITPVSGREYFAALQETSEVTVKIYIRYLEDVTAKMRVKHGEHIYDIIDVLSNRMEGICTIMAKEAY